MIRWRTLALVVAFFACCRVAWSQGAEDMAPSPIALAELHRFIAMRALEPLTDDEWQRIEKAHDDYLEAMRAVRAGVIESALQRSDLVSSQVSGSYDPAAQRDLLRRREAVASELATKDSEFFDAVAAILGETRLSVVESLRERRALIRSAYAFQVHFTVDVRMPLSDAFRNATLLTAEDRVRIEDALRSFEAQEPKLIKAFGEAKAKRTIRMSELVSAAETDLFAAGNRGQWTVTFERCVAETPEYDQTRDALLNARERFVASTLRAVPFDARRQVRSSLYNTDENSPWRDPTLTERNFRAALRSKALADDQRRAVRDLYEQWAKADDAIVDGARPQSLSRVADVQALSQSVWAERQRIGDTWQTKLQAVLPAELLNAVQKGGMEQDPFDVRALEEVDRTSELPMMRVLAGGIYAVDERVDPFRSDWRLPPTTSASVLAWLPDVNVQDRITIETLLGDVQETWDRDIRPLLRSGAAVNSAMWNPASTDEEIEAGSKAKFAAYDAAEKLDRTNFENLKAALPAAHHRSIDGARLERMLTIWADGESLMGLNTAWEVEFLANVARLVRTTSPADARAALETILLEESDRLIAAAMTRRRDEFRWSAKSALAMKRSWTTQHDQTPEGVAEFAKLREAERLAGVALVAARRTSNDEFRRVLARMLEALPESERWRFRLGYERDAYPTLFFDRGGFQQFYDRAVTLPSMTDERKERLRTLAASFEERRAKSLFAYVDLARAEPAFGKPNENGLANRRREAEFFERNEINTRAVAALRRELTPEERRQIHGIAEYELAVTRLSNSWWR